MKMARATAEDVKILREFLEWLEKYCEFGVDASKEYDEENGRFPAIDEEEALQFIRRQFYRYSRKKNVGHVWNRVVMGYEVLHDNCCDLEKNYLEWKPELLQIIEAGTPMEICVDVHPFAADAFVTEAVR